MTSGVLKHINDVLFLRMDGLPNVVRPSVVYPFILSILVWFPSGVLFAFSPVFFIILYLHLSIGLTFDGFVRFSRYKLSHNHPFLDKIVSSMTIITVFLGLLPISLGLYAYSLAVSPDNPEIEASYKWYDRDFIIPLCQNAILIFAFIGLFFNPFYSRLLAIAT